MSIVVSLPINIFGALILLTPGALQTGHIELVSLWVNSG